MTEQNLKFACAFCNFNSVHKQSVRSHVRFCPEKYNIQIDPKNNIFFRMVDVKDFPNDRENKKIEKNKIAQLKIKEKKEREKRFQIFVNTNFFKKIDFKISKIEILLEYSKMYLEFNNDDTHLLSYIRNEGYKYKDYYGCFIDIQFKQ
jgi:hypothetical protein